MIFGSLEGMDLCIEQVGPHKLVNTYEGRCRNKLYYENLVRDMDPCRISQNF